MPLKRPAMRVFALPRNMKAADRPSISDSLSRTKIQTCDSREQRDVQCVHVVNNDAEKCATTTYTGVMADRRTHTRANKRVLQLWAATAQTCTDRIQNVREFDRLPANACARTRFDECTVNQSTHDRTPPLVQMMHTNARQCS